MFPQQVDVGSRRPSSFDWMLARTRDATGETAPRELIHLLSEARERQLQLWEVGNTDPGDDTLFDRVALREALPEVSKVRLEQTLFAEYPTLKGRLQQLDGEKT